VSEVSGNFLNFSWLVEEGDDLHLLMAFRTLERVNFEDFLHATSEAL